MPYRSEICIHEDHLRLELSGQRNAATDKQDAIEVWTSVAESCRQHGLDRILAVYELIGPIAMSNVFELANHPEKLAWDRRFRLAFVTRDAAARKELDSAETIAVNRGFAVRVFDDEVDAKNWLFKDRAGGNAENS